METWASFDRCKHILEKAYIETEDISSQITSGLSASEKTHRHLKEIAGSLDMDELSVRVRFALNEVKTKFELHQTTTKSL